VRKFRDPNLPKRFVGSHAPRLHVVTPTAESDYMQIGRALQSSLKSEVALRVYVASRQIAYLTVDERSIELRTDLVHVFGDEIN